MSQYDEKPFPLDFHDLKLLSHLEEILFAWREDGFPGMREKVLEYKCELNEFNRKTLANYSPKPSPAKPLRIIGCVQGMLLDEDFDHPPDMKFLDAFLPWRLNEKDKAWLKAIGIEPPDCLGQAENGGKQPPDNGSAEG